MGPPEVVLFSGETECRGRFVTKGLASEWAFLFLLPSCPNGSTFAFLLDGLPLRSSSSDFEESRDCDSTRPSDFAPFFPSRRLSLEAS